MREEISDAVEQAVRSADPRLLDDAARGATTRRERQLVAIAHAWLDGDHDLVAALATDHLAEFPDEALVGRLTGGRAGRGGAGPGSAGEEGLGAPGVDPV